jgi:hypothetical protein
MCSTRSAHQPRGGLSRAEPGTTQRRTACRQPGQRNSTATAADDNQPSRHDRGQPRHDPANSDHRLTPPCPAVASRDLSFRALPARPRESRGAGDTRPGRPLWGAGCGAAEAAAPPGNSRPGSSPQSGQMSSYTPVRPPWTRSSALRAGWVRRNAALPWPGWPASGTALAAPGPVRSRGSRRSCGGGAGTAAGRAAGRRRLRCHSCQACSLTSPPGAVVPAAAGVWSSDAIISRG